MDREHVALKAYVAGISTRLFTQRATAVFNADIFALPFPEDGNLDLSANERILTDDIVTFQRDFIRLGTRARLMHSAPVDALEQFDSTLLDQINAVYGRNPLQALPSYHWSGAICRAYALGDGQVDWAYAEALRHKLDGLLYERRGSGLTINRITRLYDQGFVFLLKPCRHRFWTRSVALRDADDILPDLRAQGF